MAQSPLSLDSFTSFGELLKHLRKRAGLTQRELAQAVNYTDSYITRLENNTRPPDPAVIRALFIDALGLQQETDAARRLMAFAEAARAKAGQSPDSAIPDEAGQTGNLPAQLTGFIGREHELTEVLRRIGSARLLTLTGAGGVGKTRLAIEAASRLQADYLDGVWLAELASLTDAALVGNTVATALGLHVAAQPARETLIDHLRNKHTLLVIDNCEHVIAVCAELVEALLRACPKLCILATSREALNVPGEVAWRVPSMHTDEAVQLFETRALAAIPESALAEKDAGTIAKICERLDGIPLAIELAAARLRVYSLDMIAARLDDRFKLLTGGARTALPRQQTLYALIDWSYNLLSADEQKLFRYLSVFAGGWTLEGLEAANPDLNVVELLPHLVDKSLVVMEQRIGQRRYMMLETLRQFAVEMLAAQDEVDEAHTRMAAYLEQVSIVLRGDRVKLARQRMAELNNLRILVTWSRKRKDATAFLRLVATLVVDFTWDYFESAEEVLSWMTEALTHGNDAPDELRVIVFGRQLGLRYFMGFYLADWVDEAEAFLSLAERIGGIATAEGRSEILWWCGLANWHAQNFDRVAILYERGLEYFIATKQLFRFVREWGLGLALTKKQDHALAADHFRQSLIQGFQDDVGSAFFLGVNGFTWLDPALALREVGPIIAKIRERTSEEAYFRALQSFTQPLIITRYLSEAQSALHECLSFWRRAGVFWATSLGSAQALLDLGQVAWLQGDARIAQAWFAQSLDEYQQVGDYERIARLLIYIGLTEHAEGDLESAGRNFQAGLRRYRELRQPAGIALALAAIARLAEARGEMAQAARLFGFAALPQEFLAVSILWPASPVIYQHEIAQARERFAGTPWMQSWHEGERMTQEEAITLAQQVV